MNDPLYTPRSQLLSYHSRDQRWATLVIHRRGGKTVLTVNDLVIRAAYGQKPNGRYAYIAPFYSQAKALAWDYLKHYSAPYTVGTPKESELSVTLNTPMQPTIRLFGADNIDSLRGMYFDGVVLDEYQLMHLGLFSSVIRPALVDRRGFCTFSGTFNSPDNVLTKLYEEHKNDPDWFTFLLRASESNIIPPDELAAALADMGPDEYDLEFECNPYALQKGLIYGIEMAEAARSGRLDIDDDALYDPSYKVLPVFDIGSSDPTAISFVQVVAGEPRVIDYWEASRASVDEVHEVLEELKEERGYQYGPLCLPHDAFAKTFAAPKTVVEQFSKLNYQIRRVPSVSIQEGIQVARRTLRNTVFAKRATPLVVCLRNYNRKYNKITKSYARSPAHDTPWSHGADSYRYLGLITNERQDDMIVTPSRGRIVVPKDYTLDALWAERPQQNGRIS